MPKVLIITLTISLVLIVISAGYSSEAVIKPEMVLIKGGTVQMTINHSVTIGEQVVEENNLQTDQDVQMVQVNNFYMGKYLVTNNEYCAFLNSEGNQYEKGDNWMSWREEESKGIVSSHSKTKKFKVKSGYENHPAVFVTWYGAVAYCNWLSSQEGLGKCYGEKGNRGEVNIKKKGYRLPTQAEWEFSCRAGTTTKYYWGDKMDGSYCWYNDNSDGIHHTVGKKLPNAYGLYDMIGNVYEWCNDWFNDERKDARELRGGGFLTKEYNCQVGLHNGCSPSSGNGSVGFRLARTP